MTDRLRRRDTTAFEYLYHHYSAALYGIILRVIRREDVAEEVLQDVFLKIWDRIQDYDASKGRLFTWMLNIARNQAIDRTRSREMSQYRKTDDLDNLVRTIDLQDSAVLNHETIGLKELLGRLPEEHRFIIEKLYLEGYTQSAIVEEFNIPLGTVKTRTRAAMSTLRTLLKVT